MALQGDMGLYLSGQQVKVPSCNIVITQPTVRQIVVFGEDDFLIAVQLLGKTENFVGDLRKDNSLLAALPSFQLLLVILREDPQIANAIKNFFGLIAPEYEIVIDTGFINFFVDEVLVGQLTPYNFESFQSVIIDLFEQKNGKSEDIQYNINENDQRAKEILEKLNKGKKKIAEMRNKTGEYEKTSLFGSYISILSVGLGMDINTLYDYTPFQLNDMFMRYFAKVQSDFYQKLVTTPLIDTSNIDEPKEWVGNLYI